MGTGIFIENPKQQHQMSRYHKPLPNWVVFMSGSFATLLVVWSFFSFAGVPRDPEVSESTAVPECTGAARGYDPLHDPPERTFYDDPEVGYTFGSKVTDWDGKRKRWLELHPSFAVGTEGRVIMVTGSQPTPCSNPIGDHLLLRLFKNKVDYCRIHGCDVFYNNVLLQPEMFTFWAKYPAIRAAMVAHPEAEWIWWVDSDAAISDMDFKLPLDRYRNHNLVIHGWRHQIVEERSWTGLNAGVFLIRNCQWSLDLMTLWAGMGPQSPDYDRWGELQRSVFKDKLFPESDDQSALAYIIVQDPEQWTEKIYLEGEYYFEGYWVEIVGKLENVAARYKEVESGARRLRRRRAEKVAEGYGALWEEYLKIEGASHGKRGWRRPFITHFTGCQPCSGNHNKAYGGSKCWDGMIKALNFADDQVLRSFGYAHTGLMNSSSVVPLPFDYPSSD